MDPLKQAAANQRRKYFRNSWVEQDGEQILKVEMGEEGGEGGSIPANPASQDGRSVPGEGVDQGTPYEPRSEALREAARRALETGDKDEKAGGFGGPEHDFGDDPVDEEDEEWMQQQRILNENQQRYAADRAAGIEAPDWTDPYNEPVEDNGEGEMKAAYRQGDETGVGLVDQYGMLDEDVERIRGELQDEGVDDEIVSPTYLQRKYGLSREQAIALTMQLWGPDSMLLLDDD